jgi:hypothetical protein
MLPFHASRRDARSETGINETTHMPGSVEESCLTCTSEILKDESQHAIELYY